MDITQMDTPIRPELKRPHARRLRELYRSAGWPYQDVIEIELLAAGCWLLGCWDAEAVILKPNNYYVEVQE